MVKSKRDTVNYAYRQKIERKEKMKKVLALVMVMVMVFALCACGGSGSPATIVDNDGNTVQMTAEELVSIYE